jgi:hypothetical protein
MSRSNNPRTRQSKYNAWDDPRQLPLSAQEPSFAAWEAASTKSHPTRDNHSRQVQAANASAIDREEAA